jgi:carbamoyl-phosphate synthase large subunit
MVGQTLDMQGVDDHWMPRYYSVKESVFPFIKFPGVDTVLGPEMKSTGEVMGVAESFGGAFDKASRGAGSPIPRSGTVLVSVRSEDQGAIVPIARYFSDAGFEIVATPGTAKMVSDAGIPVERVNKVIQGRPHVVDRIKNDDFCMIINTTSDKQSLKDSFTIRREALLHKVTYFTTIAGARAAVEAHRASDSSINKLQDLHHLGVAH